VGEVQHDKRNLAFTWVSSSIVANVCAMDALWSARLNKARRDMLVELEDIFADEKQSQVVRGPGASQPQSRGRPPHHPHTPCFTFGVANVRDTPRYISISFGPSLSLSGTFGLLPLDSYHVRTWYTSDY
jgi:hypothetical protein